MPKHLVDFNLPQTYNPWQGVDFIYAISIKIDGDDNLIWNYAQINNLTILSRDKDFADRMLHANPQPKVIHFRLAMWEKIVFSITIISL